MADPALAFPASVVVEVSGSDETLLRDEVFRNGSDSSYVLAKDDGRLRAGIVVLLHGGGSEVSVDLLPYLPRPVTLTCDGGWSNDWRITSRGRPDLLVRLNPPAGVDDVPSLQRMQAEVSKWLRRQ